jgi:uncharacterized membrane protein
MNAAYTFWKTAHILSAAVLFGTGLGIAFFCWFGYGVFVLVGLCWLPVVALQLRLLRAAQAADSIETLPHAFRRWFAWWFALGVPAFGGVLYLFYLMVAKPLPVT